MWCLYSTIVVVVFLLSLGDAKVRYNSQVQSTQNIQLADLTGDGLDEFYLFQDDRLYVTTIEYIVHGITYIKLPAVTTRVINGLFNGGPRAMLCAQEPSLNKLDCYTINSNNESVPLFSQTDFIGSDDVIIGDFNGNGMDDILCYTPSTGAFRAYSFDASNPTAPFITMPNWSPGDLGTSYVNCQVLAGDFGTPDGITDIFIFNPPDVNTYILLSQVASSKYSLKFSFKGTPGWQPDTYFRIAEIDGDGADDVFGIFGGSSAGAYPVVPGFLSASVTAVDRNPLKNMGQYTAFLTGKFKNVAGEDGGKTNLRDDILVYTDSTKKWTRFDARLVATKRSYVVNYAQFPLILNEDQDNDAILTKYELGGYDPDNNGVSDGILNSYGASPFMKDIFVQVDYMDGPPRQGWDYSLLNEAKSLAVALMAEYNLNLHIFQQNKIAFKENLGSPKFDWVKDFDPIKSANLEANRAQFFHYCLLARQYDAGFTTGLSRDIVASDFLVTLMDKGTVGKQVGTFLHELGHNLGLRHGSTDDINYKPNHLSIMNYNYQWAGVYKNQYKYVYSDMDCNDLNENLLIEQDGVQCIVTPTNLYSTLVTDFNEKKSWKYVNGPIDWNANGKIDKDPIVDDINEDGSDSIIKGGVNEYAILDFSGIPIAKSRKRRPASEHELREPPHWEIPTSPETFRTNFSSFFLSPHNGSHFLHTVYRQTPSSDFIFKNHLSNNIYRHSNSSRNNALGKNTVEHNKN